MRDGRAAAFPRLQAGLDALVRWLALLSGLCLIFLMGLTVVDVIGRYVFHAPIFGAQHGAAGATTFDDRCPGDEIAIGLSGSADDQFVDRVSLRCGRVSIARSRSFNWQLTVTPTGSTTPRGAAGIGETFTATCATGSVIMALDGRESTRVNRLGASCQRLQLSLR